MSKNEILSGLLERNLNIKMEGLEKRFEREGMDISTLEITMDTMKSKYNQFIIRNIEEL